MAKKIRSEQVDGVVPYTGATQNVNLGDRNLEFTAGSLSRVQNGSRVFNKVYQGYNSGNTTGILSLRVPSIGTHSMFDIVAKFFSYSVKFIGEVRISFYKNGNVIHSNAAKAVISGSSNFPVNTVQVGLDENQNICINLGTITTVWGSYLSFEIERVETKYGSVSLDWSQGWNHIIETVAPDLVANGGKFLSLLNNASFGTELNFGHANKSFLDDINQNLGTARTPTFNGIITGYVTGAYKGFSSSTPFAFLNTGQAQRIYTGGVLASNSYADASKIPVNGIYSKGNILTGGGFAKEGGTASQFWKADGSIDSNNYALSSHSHTWSQITSKPDFHAVAISGDYSDLNGLPTIPSYSVGTVSNIENGDTTAKIWTGEAIHEYALNNYIEQTHPASNVTSTLLNQWSEAHGWGNHSTAGYALASGMNATGSWANSSNGLENNPTLPGKTMAGAVTASLQDANNGTIAGYLNSYGTAAGNPDSNWWYRIKMLHANPAGYNGEIAVQMTGGNSLRYRKTENGHYGGWIETVDQNNVIIVGGKKMFYTFGNNYNDIALEAYSDTAAYPAIAFHKAGQYAGSIAMANSHLFQFRDLAGTSLVHTGANISFTENGFVHNGHNDQDILLTSDGGAIHKKDLILTKVVQTVQDFEYLDLTVNLEFREYQVIIWNDAATINIPAASSEIMGMKIVIKLIENTHIYYAYPILEVNGNQWGTIINDPKIGIELVCRGDSWVSTLIGQTMEIVL